MSQFNIYARKLDTAFKEARSEYNTVFRALQEAQQASRDANAWRPGVSAEEKQVRTARAALKLHDAEATFNEVSAFGTTSRPRAARSAQSWNRKCAPPTLQTQTPSTATRLNC